MMNGSQRIVDGRPALCFERRLSHPIERVWRAITEPAELAQWFVSEVPWTPRVGEMFEAAGESGRTRSTLVLLRAAGSVQSAPSSSAQVKSAASVRRAPVRRMNRTRVPKGPAAAAPQTARNSSSDRVRLRARSAAGEAPAGADPLGARGGRGPGG